MSFCINCVHHQTLAGTDDHFCRHPEYVSKPDLVTGAQTFPKCRDMRVGDCGEEGRFFQGRPEPRLTDKKPARYDPYNREWKYP